MQVTESLIMYGEHSVPVPKVDAESIDKVRHNFGSFAEKMLHAKAEIVDAVKEAIKKGENNYPESTSQISVYEGVHKELKKVRNRLYDEVKVFTTKLNEVANSMRAPVNVLDDFIKDWEAALLDVKLKAKAEEERIKNIQIEQIRIRQQFLTLKADYLSKAQDRAIKAFDEIVNKVMESDNPPTTSEALATVVTNVARNPKFKGGEYFRDNFMNAVKFVYTKPDDYDFDFVSIETECLEAIRNIIIDNAVEWARAYMEGKVEKVVSGQTIEKVAEKVEEVEIEVSKGQFTYTDIDIIESGKPVKKFIEIDLPETAENAIFIISLFMQHRNKMIRRLKELKKPYSLSIDRMKKYLEDAINDDEIEIPNDVPLKEVNRL